MTEGQPSLATDTRFRSLVQPDLRNLAKVEFWQGRTLVEKGEGRIAHLERALAAMAELGRNHDRAQIFDVLGDVHGASDPAAAGRYYRQAAEIYEDGGRLLAAAASQHKLGLLDHDRPNECRDR